MNTLVENIGGNIAQGDSTLSKVQLDERSRAKRKAAYKRKKINRKKAKKSATFLPETDEMEDKENRTIYNVVDSQSKEAKSQTPFKTSSEVKVLSTLNGNTMTPRQRTTLGGVTPGSKMKVLSPSIELLIDKLGNLEIVEEMVEIEVAFHLSVAVEDGALNVTVADEENVDAMASATAATIVKLEAQSTSETISAEQVVLTDVTSGAIVADTADEETGTANLLSAAESASEIAPAENSDTIEVMSTSIVEDVVTDETVTATSNLVVLSGSETAAAEQADFIEVTSMSIIEDTLTEDILTEYVSTEQSYETVWNNVASSKSSPKEETVLQTAVSLKEVEAVEDVSIAIFRIKGNHAEFWCVSSCDTNGNTGVYHRYTHFVRLSAALKKYREEFYKALVSNLAKSSRATPVLSPLAKVPDLPPKQWISMFRYQSTSFT